MNQNRTHANAPSALSAAELQRLRCPLSVNERNAKMMRSNGALYTLINCAIVALVFVGLFYIGSK